MVGTSCGESDSERSAGRLRQTETGDDTFFFVVIFLWRNFKLSFKVLQKVFQLWFAESCSDADRRGQKSNRHTAAKWDFISFIYSVYLYSFRSRFFSIYLYTCTVCVQVQTQHICNVYMQYILKTCPHCSCWRYFFDLVPVQPEKKKKSITIKCQCTFYWHVQHQHVCDLPDLTFPYYVHNRCNPIKNVFAFRTLVVYKDNFRRQCCQETQWRLVINQNSNIK